MIPFNRPAKFISIVTVLLLMVTTTLGQKNADDCFFIHLTDPQFGMFEKNKSFSKETVLYEKAVEGINRLEPEFVVITGDFVHNENSEEQISEFKRLTAKINDKIPVYYSPGNHDVGRIPDKHSLKKYRKNYGKDRFVFSHNGILFVGFNTSLIKGKLEKKEKKQFKWLQNQLESGADHKHVIVFCHYPFFIKNVDEPTAYANIDIEYRKKYLDLFASKGVDVVFSGHHHNNILNSYGELELVTTSAAGKPLGNAPSGMRIVKVKKDKIEHSYFGYEELPESIDF